MASICVTCSVKGKTLSPLSDEYRQLLHHIVSPVVNMIEFGDHPLHVCLTCNLWMEDVYNFQKKARKGVRTFKAHLSLLEKQPPADQMITINPIIIEPMTIKTDPDKQTDPNLSPIGQQFISVPASIGESPQTVKIEVKLEPESKIDYVSNDMNADDLDTSLPDPFTASGSVGSTGSSITGEQNMINIVPNVQPNPDVEQSPKLISTQMRKTVTKQISVKSILAEKFAQLTKTGKKVAIIKIINPLDSQQNVSSSSHGAENAIVDSTHEDGKKMSQDSKQGVRKVRKRIRKKKVPAMCTLCGKIFSGNQTLYIHNIRKHRGSKGRPSCEKCGKSFCSEIGLKEHMKRKHEEGRGLSSCQKCGKSFCSELGLKEHMKRKHEEPKEMSIEDMNPEWFCAECAIQFKTRRDYDLHMLTLKHTPREQCAFVCEFCAKRFATQSRLDSHVNSMHLGKVEKKVFKCELCEKTYASSFTLRAHVRTAHENQPKKRPHVCHLCGKSFTAKNNLAEHLLVHQGLRPYKCPLCPATFSYSGALFTHKKHVHGIQNKTGGTGVNPGVETKKRRRKVKKAEAD